MNWRRNALLVALLASTFTAAQNASGPKTIAPAGLVEPIQLDGRLNEPSWKSAPVVAELVQQSPRPGEPTRYKTVVRVIASVDRLYLGFECTDPEPDRISVHTMQRDGDFKGDDTITIVLDTYGDKKTGYLFQVNAAGARADGLISGPDRSSLDWDGIWDARTSRTVQGWSVEVVIPTRTLSFTPGLESWGLNFERSIPRERMKLQWASPTLDSFVTDLSRAGLLTGVSQLKQGSGLEISPFAVGRIKDGFAGFGRAWQAQPGIDVTYRMTPELAAVFTANTDFAETEVDARQINLTRFPLFFPEKRSFFLEGANQFTFGLGLGQTFLPFFSRRVGLLDGNPIPIDAGVKLNGRIGNWNVALLDVQTRDSRYAPGTNLFAGRVSYDVTKELRIGTILTHGDPTGLRSNTLAGFDALWRTSKFLGDKNFLLGGWTALSKDDPAPGTKSGWGTGFDFPNDLLDCSGGVDQFGDALNPSLGFLPRPGTRQYRAACAFQPRPSKDGPLRWIRQEFFENEYVRVDNLKGFTESWEYFMAPINVRLESGDRFEFNWSPRYEYLPVPFEISPGVVLPVGPYPFTRWRIEAQTSEHRVLQVGFTTWFGTFYNGHLTQWENYVKWTSPHGRWQAGISTEQDFGQLKQGNFVQRLWQTQLAYALNPNLVLTSFIQYDTESHNIGSNIRVRWTVKPGNDLFIVWNRGWKRLILSPHELGLIPDSELVAIKLRWTFRP